MSKDNSDSIFWFFILVIVVFFVFGWFRPLWGFDNSELIDLCLDKGGVIKNSTCVKGNESNTRYSYSFFCEGLDIDFIIHSNESIDIIMPSKLARFCGLVVKDRGGIV